MTRYTATYQTRSVDDDGTWETIVHHGLVETRVLASGALLVDHGGGHTRAHPAGEWRRLHTTPEHVRTAGPISPAIFGDHHAEAES